MKIDDIAQASLLYDFYGQLLPKRQNQVMELYHEENLSLSEIADEFGISRQGVHDALKNAEKALREYEEKLGLVERFMANKASAVKIRKLIDRLEEESELSEESLKTAEQIRMAVDEITQ